MNVWFSTYEPTVAAAHAEKKSQKFWTFNVSHSHQVKPSEIDLRVHFNSMLWVACMRCSFFDHSERETLLSIHIPCARMSDFAAVSVSHRRPSCEHCFHFFYILDTNFLPRRLWCSNRKKSIINWNKLPSAVTTTSTPFDERECQANQHFHIHDVCGRWGFRRRWRRRCNLPWKKNRFEIESTLIPVNSVAIAAVTHPFRNFRVHIFNEWQTKTNNMEI